MHSILLIFSSVCFGILCSKIAGKKNRITSYWFFLGFLFGLIALIVIYFLKPCIDKKNFIKKTQPFDFFIILNNDKNYWYYLDTNKKQIGPMSAKALFDTYLQRKISNNTFIWNDTMNDWIKLKDVSVFSNISKQVTS